MVKGTLLFVGGSSANQNRVSQALEPLCLDVEQVSSASDALISLRHRRATLVIVNIESPELGGLGPFRELLQTCLPPVIVLSNGFVEDECVSALVWGADDYLVHPMLPREFAARIGAVLRRVGQHPKEGPKSDVSDFGRLHIDYETRQVWVGSNVVQLRAKEFDLLAYLARNPMKVSRDELLRAVWSSSSQWQDPSTVTEHARRIRLRLANEGIGHAVIDSVRSAGYRFDPQICEVEFFDPQICEVEFAEAG